MAFHVVYSRHYWDYEDGNGTFDNSWTIYRNVPYSELFKMKDAIPSLKENADQVYADYEAKRDFKTDPKQFHMSEVFICDDEEYYKTYSDVYDLHETPYADSSYYHDYGQNIPFMLLKDFKKEQSVKSA
tara:strand:- start:2384 stop:2770 length:387 start_codon:yes stop_codon:yes gene_type:complete